MAKYRVGKCHLEKAVKADWRPQTGLDPRLREYECPICHEKFLERDNLLDEPKKES